ncbi:hypothetical protein D1007_51318 [Hordeum vulgare]|nr:hypothetical protein D1007_51318 [Hordeum vulgare]
MGLVKVTNGTVTTEQVSQQLRRLVSETYHLAPDKVDDQSFQVEFPRREDLQRLLTFGVSKVWIRFSGIPEILLNDFLIVWSLGSLIDKTEKVNMPFTRKRGIARLLVMVLDVEYIPDFAPWSYDGVHYDLDVELEEDTQHQSQDSDVHMADGEDRDRDQGDANQDEHSERPKENANPPSSSANDKPLNSGAAPSSCISPMATLRFGSFEVMPTLTRLWGEVCVEEGFHQPIEESMLHEETCTTSSALLSHQEVVTPPIISAKLDMEENHQTTVQVASATRDTLVTLEGGRQEVRHSGASAMPLCSSSKEMLRSPTSDSAGGRIQAYTCRFKEKQQVAITKPTTTIQVWYAST